MIRYKDWKPGEFRIEAEIIDTSGDKLTARLTEVPEKFGSAFLSIICMFSVYRNEDRDKWPEELRQVVDLTSDMKNWKKTEKTNESR